MKKRFIACLFAMSLMASTVLSANAAEHKHSYIKEPDSSVYTKVVSYDAGSHTLVYMRPYKCTGCSDGYDIEEKRTIESHNIIYTDYGYDANGDHHYNAHCSVCSFNQTL